MIKWIADATRKLFGLKPAESKPALPSPDDRLRLAGERALAEAVRYWELDIYDPSAWDHSARADRSRKLIDEFLRACGWTWKIPYRGNEPGAVQWCGIFAGACWRAAGIDPRWLATYFASTMRLAYWVRYRAWDDKHPNPRPASVDGLRQVSELGGGKSPTFTPRAGDILIVGDGKPGEGDHITLVVSYNAATRTFSTINGNGGGHGPDGKRREGVVRTDYTIGGPGYRALWLLRPGIDDLVGN